MLSSQNIFTESRVPTKRSLPVRRLIPCVCRTIADWGIKDGYFSKKDGEIFYNELSWLCHRQYGAFQFPVWFNVRLYHQYGVGKDSAKGAGISIPRSASLTEHPLNTNFLNAAHVSSNLSKTIWKTSCGLPTVRPCSSNMDREQVPDLSSVRSSKEKLSGGGRPSGPCPS